MGRYPYKVKSNLKVSIKVIKAKHPMLFNSSKPEEGSQRSQFFLEIRCLGQFTRTSINLLPDPLTSELSTSKLQNLEKITSCNPTSKIEARSIVWGENLPTKTKVLIIYEHMQKGFASFHLLILGSTNQFCLSFMFFF